MGNSLQDQLLKSGLVSQEQIDSAAKPRPKRGRRPGKARPGHRPKAPAKQRAEPSPPPIEVLNAQIRALLDEHRMNDNAGEIPYSFTRENRVKRLYVTEAQRDALLRGELAIAGYRRVHHILPGAIADRILSLRDEIFVHRADPDRAGDAETDHPVPDDLVW